jgi:hypothetical protein
MYNTFCHGPLRYFQWLSEISPFLGEKIPRIKESVSHVKGDVLIHGFMWVNTMEYALEVRGLMLKIHISLTKVPQRGIIKYGSTLMLRWLQTIKHDIASLVR